MPRFTIYSRTDVIHHTKAFKNCPTLRGNGPSAKRVRLIKDRNTIDGYLSALQREGLPSGLGDLERCVNKGYVKPLRRYTP